MRNICRVEGCEKYCEGNGYCTKHYYQMKRHGKIFPDKIGPRLCEIEGCGRKHVSNGHCTRHESQVRLCGGIKGHPSRSKKDKNEYIADGDIARMIIFDNQGNPCAEAIIDTDDVERCMPYSWSLNDNNYAASKVNGKYISLHRFILKVSDHAIEVDHKNRNRLDCRKGNLRTCIKPQNTLNVGIRKDNTSGYKGVHYRKDNNTWSMHIDLNRKRINRSGFKTPQEAAIEYNKFAKELHGEFAYFNEVM